MTAILADRYTDRDDYKDAIKDRKFVSKADAAQYLRSEKKEESKWEQRTAAKQYDESWVTTAYKNKVHPPKPKKKKHVWSPNDLWAGFGMSGSTGSQSNDDDGSG